MPKDPHALLLVSVHGTVVALNLSPKGEAESVLIATSKGIAQVNLPKHDAEVLAATMRIGTKVSLRAEFEGDEFAHPVYRLDDEAEETVGRVVRMNYTTHGEANGALLDNGTFVHLKPEHAAAAKLQVGETIRARGKRWRGSAGTVVDAKSVERPDAVADGQATA